MIEPGHSDPPPDYENEQFDGSGLDNKAVRRLFIRKVNTDTEQTFITGPVNDSKQESSSESIMFRCMFSISFYLYFSF